MTARVYPAQPERSYSLIAAVGAITGSVALIFAAAVFGIVGFMSRDMDSLRTQLIRLNERIAVVELQQGELQDQIDKALDASVLAQAIIEAERQANRRKGSHPSNQ